MDVIPSGMAVVVKATPRSLLSSLLSFLLSSPFSPFSPLLSPLSPLLSPLSSLQSRPS
jgi:hypothetical protein